MLNPSPIVYIIGALITALALIIAALIGRSAGIPAGQQQAFATVAAQQSSPNVQQPSLLQLTQAVPDTQIIPITKIVEVTKVIEVTREVEVTKVVEVTPTPPPLTTPASPAPYYFQEEFDGSSLDESKWEASGPPVEIKGGVVHLESNLAVFPYRGCINISLTIAEFASLSTESYR